MTSNADSLPLIGLDGSNPLAFLAALGTLRVADGIVAGCTLHWQFHSGRQRPVLIGLGADPEQALEAITEELLSLPTDVFEVNARLPFDSEEFRIFLMEASNAPNRRNAEFGCALGSEVCVDEKSGSFKDSAFRMVRSGDSAGNGLLSYAQRIRKSTDKTALRRALFDTWDYADGPPEFRWDPIGDKPYAHGWGDPAKETARTMLGANSLALEALPLFPTVPDGPRVRTTGFHRRDKQVYFTWPIWSLPATVDVVRSLLTLPELGENEPDRASLAARGITEVYRCRRFPSSQYYSNFSPAASV